MHTFRASHTAIDICIRLDASWKATGTIKSKVQLLFEYITAYLIRHSGRQVTVSGGMTDCRCTSRRYVKISRKIHIKSIHRSECKRKNWHRNQSRQNHLSTCSGKIRIFFFVFHLRGTRSSWKEPTVTVDRCSVSTRSNVIGRAGEQPTGKNQTLWLHQWDDLTHRQLPIDRFRRL